MPWWCLSRPTYLDDRSTGVCVPLWAFPLEDLGQRALRNAILMSYIYVLLFYVVLPESYNPATYAIA